MAKMADAGYSTGIVDLTRGETGTRGTPETRLREAARAGKILGVKVRRNLGLPDAHLRVCEEHKAAIAEVIRELEPRTVVLPYWEGRHPDHYTSSILGYEACFIAGLKNYPPSGRGVQALQDHLCGCLRAGDAHVCRGHHQVLREAQEGDSVLRVAIPAAQEGARPKGQLATR